MKVKTKFLCVVLGVIVLLFSSYIVYVNYYENYTTINETKSNASVGELLKYELSEAEVKEDAKEIINILEKTHPIFIEKQTDKYKEAKVRFLSETDKKMNIDDFKISVSKYLSSIQDGHTRVAWEDAKYLDVNWKYLNGKLIIFDDKNRPMNKVVTQINGVAIKNIFSRIDELFPAENYSAIALNYEQYSKGDKVLKYSGVDCSKDMTLTVTNGNSEERVKVNFINSLRNYPLKPEIYSKKIDDKTVYVKFGICELNSKLEKVVEELKQNINNGTKNVIIDVMNNPGGNSQACDKLFEASKIKTGEFGSVVKYSPLAKKERGYWRSWGYSNYRSNNEAVGNPDIKLFVITNEQTFSSAQWLATLVKDGNLGTIVGRASSNMPSSFGDVLTFKLKNSQLEGQVSHKKWTRPDMSKDNERVLAPDVYVDYSEDAVKKVMEMISTSK